MKACVLYFSMTGNTRRFAEAISEFLTIAVFDINNTGTAAVNDFDILTLETPVHGSNPSKKILSFVDHLPDGKGKRAILFLHLSFMERNHLRKTEEGIEKEKLQNYS